jgi:RNA polymerase sigma factor (sigma-70 family)
MEPDRDLSVQRIVMQKLDQYEKGPNALESTLYDRHAPALYRYIFRRVSQPQDAEDMLLEVFLIACRYENLGDLPLRRQIAWLQSVARRRIIDRYRRLSRVELLPLDQALEALDDEMTPEEQALHKETYERLYAALAQLPAVQQQIVHLRYGNGLRFAEIATMLNTSEGTVRKMLVRILRQLRAIYNRQEGELD